MQLFNKFCIAVVIFIIAGLANAIPAGSTGLVYDWEPFIARTDPGLNVSVKEIIPKYFFISSVLLEQPADNEEILHSDLDIKSNLVREKSNNSVLSKIKVTVSQVNSFMMPGDEIYSRSKDGKLTQMVRTLPSFFQNPLQENALETLKLIEPQVNLGFEF